MWNWMATMILAGAVSADTAAVKPGNETPAGRILRATNLREGLCVVVGSDGRLAADLAGTGSFLVHVLAAREDDLERIREHLRRRGLYGRASAEAGRFNSLPHADNLVNLLVVEDLPSARARGLTVGEIMRVLAPGGVAVFRGEAKDLQRLLKEDFDYLLGGKP